jgi:ABC-type transport system involved in Fe-S cluster assembly, permease component
MSNQDIDQLVDQDYKYGFVTEIESDTLPPGLNEDVIREISKRKGEPAWLLEWRLEAYHKWLQMTPPDWAHLEYPAIDFQTMSYFSAPKNKDDAQP